MESDKPRMLITRYILPRLCLCHSTSTRKRTW